MRTYFAMIPLALTLALPVAAASTPDKGDMWERGQVHPYVTGGIGLSDKSASSGLPSRFDDRGFGVNAGGGLNWFVGAPWGLKFEGTIHAMSGETPDALCIGTAGAMFWF
jgi:hypothetical protein